MPGGRPPKPRARGAESTARSPRKRPSVPKNRTPSAPASKGHPQSTEASAGSTPTPRSRPQQDPAPGNVAVGRVLAPFGLKGELKVQPLTDNPQRFAPNSRLLAGDQRVTVAAAREASGHLYVRLKGFADRGSVEKFRHALLQVPESALPPLAEGEYYRFQLIGLAVVDRDGAAIGTLEEIIETGANDVYRVHTREGADVLLPALDDVIISVDLASRRMVVDPPEWR